MLRSCLAVVLVLVTCPRVAFADGLRNVDRATSGHSTSHSSSGGSRSSSNRSSSGSRSAGSGRSSSSSASSHYTSRSSSSSSGHAYDEERCQSDPEYCESSPLVTFMGVLFFAPWAIPWLFFDHPELVRYAPYPFADGPGLLRPQLDDEIELGFPPPRKVALALDVESGYLLQGVVPAGLALRLMLPYRLELDTRFSGLVDVEEHPHDVASASTTHLTYRFAQGERYDFRTGLGLRTFDLEKLRLGFDLYWAVDAYFGPCVVWRVELHLGSAGDAFVGQARSTLGVMLSRFELYAGYDHTAYLSDGYKAALGGPIVGLRAWF